MLHLQIQLLVLVVFNIYLYNVQYIFYLSLPFVNSVDNWHHDGDNGQSKSSIITIARK